MKSLITLLVLISVAAFGQTASITRVDTTRYHVNTHQLTTLNKLQEKSALVKQELERTEGEIKLMIEMMLGVSLDSVNLYYDPKKQEFKYTNKKQK